MTSTENVKTPLVLKAINEILNEQFFIPHYQRGYRWTDQQVKDLLNDIDSFTPVQIPGKPDEETFYCLQPIALKQCNESIKKENNLNGKWYEVVDGQQRLTTIYLIMHYANEMWSGKRKSPEITINYETRNDCVKVLTDISVEDDDETVKINKENIDYFYITSAYDTINEWVKKYELEKGKPFDENRFKSKFNSNAKIIWYEVAENENSTKLFERLNIGKIPLTNSELIKALFLNSSSFPDLSTNEQQVKRIEISRLWDEIEHRLNESDAKFWSFITNKKREGFATKIELILDMIANKSKNEKDPLATFLFFSKKQKEDGLYEIWNLIEHYYYTLNEWYKNKNLYHKIGYLITANSKVTINELVSKSEIVTKANFNSYLDEEISKTVNFELTELRYESDYNQIHNLLLLFNVETIRLSDAISEFYPFKQHKANFWSIEHVHARNSENFDQTKKETWLDWLKIHIDILEEILNNTQFEKGAVKEVLDDIYMYNKLQQPQQTWERFNILFNKINDVFVKDVESIDIESEGIFNLALLSQPDNASLNNSVFEVKRRDIIRLDKEGSFIPICTRRLFMKYYNDNTTNEQFYFWTKKDRENYSKAIYEKLNKYLPTSDSIQDEY